MAPADPNPSQTPAQMASIWIPVGVGLLGLGATLFACYENSESYYTEST